MSFPPDSITAVIFDLDGTLIEFPHDFFFGEAERILLELEHPPVRRDILTHHFASFDFFAFVDTGHMARELFVEQYWASFDWERFPKPKPFPGMCDALASLRRRGIRTAIATARPSSADEVRSELAATGMLPHIEMIATRDDPDIDWMDKRSQLSRICAGLGILPHQALLIGDIPADIESARAAGLAGAIAVLSGGIHEEVLRRADPHFIFASAVEALDKLFGCP